MENPTQEDELTRKRPTDWPEPKERLSRPALLERARTRLRGAAEDLQELAGALPRLRETAWALDGVTRSVYSQLMGDHWEVAVIKAEDEEKAAFEALGEGKDLPEDDLARACRELGEAQPSEESH